MRTWQASLTLNEMGVVLNALGRHEEALASFQESLAILKGTYVLFQSFG